MQRKKKKEKEKESVEGANSRLPRSSSGSLKRLLETILTTMPPWVHILVTRAKIVLFWKHASKERNFIHSKDDDF